jgi:hypothetical protein
METANDRSDWMKKYFLHVNNLLSAFYDKLDSYRTSWITSTCICFLISIISILYMYQYFSKSYVIPVKLSFLPSLTISKASIPATRSHREYDLYPIEMVKNHTPAQSSQEIMILPFPRNPTPTIQPISSKFVQPQKEEITPKQMQPKNRHIHASILLTYHNKYINRKR